MDYENQVKKELALWEKQMLKSTGIIEGISRNIQKKIDSYIPPKIHASISKTMEIAVKSILAGINLLPFDNSKLTWARYATLAQKDREVSKIIRRYKKLAAATGAGTGMGGILSLAIDYPALISLELKMLQEIARTFGYDIREKRERIYLLKVFMLAFSKNQCRKKTYLEVLNFDNIALDIDWQTLYFEYKETVDFKKMLQIIPGFGAVIGAWANYGLIDVLGETARNCYRMREIIK
ncbi:MAG: EcsC family protein [Clostridia bacterium]|nr:EcsC family protein [Clostridia bacterium]